MTGKRVRTRPCTHDIICGNEIGLEEEYCDFTMCDSGASFTAAVTKDGFIIDQFNLSDWARKMSEIDTKKEQKY